MPDRVPAGERPADGDAPHEARVLRVLLAEDHSVVRAGLRYLVNAQPDMRVIGEAADGDAAWRDACALLPDVLVIDVSMPVLGGPEAAERVRRDCPNVRVIALTVHEERLYLRRMLRAGAVGYVLKRAAPAELVRAIRIVSGGGTYIDPAMLDSLVEDYRDRPESADAVVPLSDREREVLLRIAQGFSNKEIAGALQLSVKTVETYRVRVGEKLGLRTRVEMVRYAARRGWLDDA